MFTSTIGLEARPLEAFENHETEKWRRSVLIVTRDAQAIEAMTDRFAAENYQVRIVSDGFVAMNEIRRSLPDIVIADVESPGISGIELADELGDWGLPVVLTIDSSDHQIPSGIAVLHSPFRVDDLIQTIEEQTTIAEDSSRVVST